MAKRKKPLGADGPHKVDFNLGFVDSVKYTIGHVANESICPIAKMDKMRIGKIDCDARRYLGNGAYERVNCEESNLNDLRSDF